MDTKIFKNKCLVFAGTFEGHALAKEIINLGLSDKFIFSVATDYGKDILFDLDELNVIEGRMAPDDMESFLSKEEFHMVIDATHPYATEVTKNILEASGKSNTKYIRLLRKEIDELPQGVIRVKNISEAVDELNKSQDKILLTTGAKELRSYKDIKNLKDRVFARVLPSHESLENCQSIDLPRKNTICMQGPFTKEMNLATMNQFGCKILVTKNTGKPGGFDDKVDLIKAGFKIIVIDRPTQEGGMSLEEVLEEIRRYYEE